MKILFFAQVKDVVGCPAIEWDLPGPIDIDAVWDQLIAEYPVLAGYRDSTRLARNGSYVVEGEMFQPGDEVALIPPVSGG